MVNPQGQDKQNGGKASARERERKRMGKGATASQHQQQNLEVGRNGSDGHCDRGKREHEFRPVNGASMPAQRPKEKIAGGNKPAGERRSEQE